MSGVETLLRIVLRDDGTLCCPVCCDVNVHIARVTVGQGSTTTSIMGEVIAVDATPTTHRRGSEVAITLWCERDHMFRYTLAFHKGETTVTVALLDECEPRTELWRD